VIKLFLENNELVRFEFTSPFTGETVKSIRGRSSGDFGNFPWSSAVQDLVKLLCGYSKDLKFSINSLSLDYALGKPPQWLLDIFGLLPSGRSASARLFIRENPEGKRFGDVTIRVNDLLIKPSDIIINSKEENLILSGRFRKALTKQYELAFKNTDPMSDPYSIASRAILHPAFKRYGRKNVSLILPELEYSYASSKRGIVTDSKIFDSLPNPLRVASNAPLMTAQSLFKMTARNYPINFDINYRYAHALEVAERIVRDDWASEPPHLAIVGIGPASYVLRNNKHDYLPLMPFLFSFDEMVGQVGKIKAFTFLQETPSTSLFYFEKLLSEGKLKKSKIVHNEPWDATKLAKDDPDFKAIMFFPYNEAAKISHGLSPVVVDKSTGTLSEMFLFAHKSLIKNKNATLALVAALRDSFYRIREDSILRESLKDEILDDKNYVYTLCRYLKAA